MWLLKECLRKYLDARLSEEISKLNGELGKKTTQSQNTTTNQITGNVINEDGLETDLTNILEPESNATNTTTETTAEASIVFENSSNGQASNASGENATNNATTETIQQTQEQNIDENINNVECDSNKIYKGEQLIIATHNSITFLKATNENGKILPGDYLTASSKAGYAAKADENSIVLIGRALEPLNTSEGKISAFVQITNNNVLNINKERLLEEKEHELDDLEEKYSIDLEDIKQEKAKQKTRIERTKEKLLANVTVSAVTALAPAPQLDYMQKVNGSVIVRLG